MRYKTPAAFEMAVKEAAKKSPLDYSLLSYLYFTPFISGRYSARLARARRSSAKRSAGTP